MTTRRDFLIKSGQVVALGAMGGVFASCNAQENSVVEHKLPQLGFEYKALEPHIDAQTMEIHHSKHHQGYVNKLNKALKGQDSLLNKSVEELLASLSSVPKNIRESVRNNGGGHYNHSLFWESMSPSTDGGGVLADGALKTALEKKFSSVDKFKETFFKQTKSIFGSGWGWLVVKDKKLEIVTTPNQDNPVSHGAVPILGLDVWEHAYYLKYQNLRGDYIKAWWNVVNWKVIEARFAKAMS
ncbi:superoxide dismutase [Mn] [Candidatus Uabimicrobium amorphum]|uniref:Superoxide dismutase n=2 Tax=Uabimicrobium amorphum TaxID=2596890 RepID=A0A5S9IQU8_UABAM|nr:superoxide dismutase [Candidatus Uabimicrobium amorphum]BBM86423.1 superoxide dismutase [Mn] [Candidatus Uabimicrobium amorphum]